jgi:hypothetical protein
VPVASAESQRVSVCFSTFYARARDSTHAGVFFILLHAVRVLNVIYRSGGRRRSEAAAQATWHHDIKHSNMASLSSTSTADTAAAAAVAALLGALLPRRSGGQAAAVIATYSMAKVKLGTREFDVNREEINAWSCGVTATDCAVLGARMQSGEVSRVKNLNLVSFIIGFVFCAMFCTCVMTDLSCAARQPNRR